MPITVALAGNPNSGKTTVFNKITGSDKYVGNWAGVTVEKKQGRALKYNNVVVTDLPGIYSLSPYSPEEIVTRTFITNDKPDVIMIIADASNLERNLFLTVQLLEMAVPAIIVLNMMDAAEKNGISINTDALSEAVGCKVFEASAVRGRGLSEAVAGAVEASETKKIPARILKYTSRVEMTLAAIERIADKKLSRWMLIKIFERDDKISRQCRLNSRQASQIEAVISECENDMDDDSESIITNERYAYIEKIFKSCASQKNKYTLSDKIDRIVTNRWLALPIFAFVMWLVYYISLSTVGTASSRWINNVLFRNIIYSNAAAFLQSLNASPLTVSLICDAVIAGVGSVLKFIPQMAILFLCLSFLEDCGYMARVAFIMDRFFRWFGLSGKSFIPLLIASGCGVPGIMASRTIENEKDRRLTIILTTFIPCGAKIPLIALISTAFFPSSAWIAPLVYFISIAAVMLSALILNKTPLFSHSDSPFLMELPQYHLPTPENLFRHVWTRIKSFIVKAGTVIFLACVAIWFLSSFSFQNGFAPAIQEDSILAGIGRFISPVFAPLGFGEWQFTLATLTGIIAKENAVGTLAVLFGAGVSIADVLTIPSALSFMLFNLFCAPCVAAIAAVKKEMRSWRWMFFSVAYQTAFAYLIAFIVYHAGSRWL